MSTLNGDRAALLDNVLTDPADDTARLVLADWLEEHDEAPFGRFVRAGVVASRFRGAELIDDPDYYAAARVISDIATAGRPSVWLSAAGAAGPSPLAFRGLGLGQRRRPGDGAHRCLRRHVLPRPPGRIGGDARGVVRTDGARARRLADRVGSCVLGRARLVPLNWSGFLTAGWRITGRVRMPRRNVPLSGGEVAFANASGAVLSQSSSEWAADQFFADRTALVAGAARGSAPRLVDDLKDAAGDRWPRPTHRQRQGESIHPLARPRSNGSNRQRSAAPHFRDPSSARVGPKHAPSSKVGER